MQTKKVEEPEERGVLPPAENAKWAEYLRPAAWSVLMNNNRLCYGLNGTVWYLAQFIGCVATINLYSDADRLFPCDVTGELANAEKSSEVYDFPLKMLAIFHMIEWIRTTVLLTVICIGANLSAFWYLTMPNTLFGIVVYAIVHMAYFSDDGKQCADVQEYRANWLLGEIIAFWVLFFIYSFPFVFTLCCGKAKAHMSLTKAYEAAQEEED